MVMLIILIAIAFLLGFGAGIWLNKRTDDGALEHQRKLELIHAEKEKEQFLSNQRFEQTKELRKY